MRLLSPLALAALSACVASPVSLTCPDGAPLCDIAALVGDPRSPAGGLRVTDVEVNQGVAVPLSEESVVPVVAGRDALVRVFVEPNDDWQVRDVTARFRVLDDEGALVGVGEGTGRPTVASEQADLASTLNVRLPGGMLLAGRFNWQVELVEAAEVATVGAVFGGTFPDDPAELEIKDPGYPTRLLIVPVECTVSGTIPDVNEAEVKSAHDLLLAYNPNSDIEVEVGEKFVFGGTPGDLNDLLSQMTTYHTTLGVDPDVYVYGWTLDNGGGLSWLAAPNTPDLRTSVGGMGLTMVHEVGHAQGLPHAPCGGAAGPDPEYPYEEAAIGAWGWDIVNSVYYDPVIFKDYMSYCDPKWVSDYNWKIVFQRQLDLTAFTDTVLGARSVPVRYATYTRFDDGRVVSAPPRQWPSRVDGETRRIAVPGPDGHEVFVEGTWVPFSHGSGGMLLVPR